MAYIATIAILVDVETEGEAMDAVAESLRPMMKPFNPQSCFRDWAYAVAGEFELEQVKPVPCDFHMDDTWPKPLP